MLRFVIPDAQAEEADRAKRAGRNREARVTSGLREALE